LNTNEAVVACDPSIVVDTFDVKNETLTQESEGAPPIGKKRFFTII